MLAFFYVVEHTDNMICRFLGMEPSITPDADWPH